MTEHRADEFDCCECGRHIIRIIPDGTGPVCGACIFMPGWFRDPEIRAVLDPSHDGRDPAEAPYAA